MQRSKVTVGDTRASPAELSGMTPITLKAPDILAY
jgi:hypothetical protein